MRKGDKRKKVLGLIVILAIIVSVFGGVVSAEDLSGGLKQSVDDAEIQTEVGNLSSADQNASIGSVTNTRLVVPFFSQKDPQWKDDLMGSSGQTIGQIGCAMTCTAMLLKYYGVSTDPGVLNAWLSTHGGYTSSGDIVWAKPAEYSNGKMQFDSMGGSTVDNDNWGVLNDELSNGYPVIVQVDAYPSTPALDSHWVLVTGRDGSQYYINDPWDLSYSSKLLSHYYDSTYDNTFFRWRVYHGSQVSTPPSPPTLTSPGTSSEPGEEINTLTPTFRWNSVSNADSYGLYISKYPYGSGNLVFEQEGLTGTSFNLPSGYLQDGVKYRWNMKAFNGAGESGYSSRLYFWVNILQPPSAPTLTSPGTSSEPGEGIDTLTPTFRWQAVSGADQYGLYISKYPYGSSNIVYENEAISGSSTSLPLPSGYLQDGVKYRWNMRAHNSAGWSSYGIEDGKTRLYFWVNIVPPNRVKGIDVSEYQGNINWPTVYDSGYRFAFARASLGDENPPTLIDDYFETNMENGHAAGMLMGAYHFAYPNYGTEASSEARHFLNVAGEYLKEGYLRPVLDLEQGEELGKEALSNWVHEWMNTVKSETGIEPIIYVNSNYANNYLDSSITQYNLWIAHWRCDTGTPPNTGIWNDWDFWQYYSPDYCGVNSVPGISGGVDLDIFNGDMDRLYTFVITGADDPTLSISPSSHDFGNMHEGVTDSTTFKIWNSGTGTLTYSLSESCDWVDVNPTSGSSTGGHDTITVDIDTVGLSEGSHTCDITISSNGGSGTFTVNVVRVGYGTPAAYLKKGQYGAEDHDLFIYTAPTTIGEHGALTASDFWSPDGNTVAITAIGMDRIAYLKKGASGEKNYDLFIYTAPTTIGEHGTLIASDFWSPDGSTVGITAIGIDRIAYLKKGASGEKNYDLFIYSAPTAIGEHGTLIASDFWSPDGSTVGITAIDIDGDGTDEIAYLKKGASSERNYDLFIYSAPTTIGEHGTLIASDFWSPDGSTVGITAIDIDDDGTDEIAYLKKGASSERNYDLFIYSAPTTIGEHGTPIASDFWSPDGQTEDISALR